MRSRVHYSDTMVPLELAVTLVQQELHESRTGSDVDLNGIATDMAAMVPLFEVAPPATTAPRRLVDIHHQAVFKDGGRELVFLDGRPAKHLLAVLADDVSCVIAMLKQPQRAQSIRGEALERQFRWLVRQSLDLKARHLELVNQFRALQLAYKINVRAGE